MPRGKGAHRAAHRPTSVLGVQHGGLGRGRPKQHHSIIVGAGEVEHDRAMIAEPFVVWLRVGFGRTEGLAGSPCTMRPRPQPCGSIERLVQPTHPHQVDLLTGDGIDTGAQ